MIRFHHIFALLCLMVVHTTVCQAESVTDTIYSSGGDWVIIKYEVTHSDNKDTIRFLKPRKSLAEANNKKYHDLSSVKVMFFDRVGSNSDVTIKGTLPIESFTVPAGAKYSKSMTGYFIIDEEPTIIFDIDKDQRPTLKIPIFLGHYEKKRNYKIFSNCGLLTINLGKKKNTKKRVSNPRSQSDYDRIVHQDTVYEQVDTKDDSYTHEEDVETRIGIIKKLLENDNFDTSDIETAKNHIANLDILQPKVSPAIQKKIDDVKKLVKQKEQELNKKKLQEEQDSINNEIKRIEQEKTRKAKSLIGDVKKGLNKDDFSPEDATLSGDVAKLRELKNDINDDEVKKDIDNVLDEYDKKVKENKKKRTLRNILLGIGAAILGLLGFGGNQWMQNRRNAQNQKSIMDMQQSMVRRAENEARRRAQSYARNKAHQAINQVKSKGRKAVQDNASKLSNAAKGKGNSIGNRIGNKGKKNDNEGISI